MKTITLTDKELRELSRLLNSSISEYLEYSLVFTDEKKKQEVIKQADVYKKIYNKLIKSLYKVKK